MCLQEYYTPLPTLISIPHSPLSLSLHRSAFYSVCLPAVKGSPLPHPGTPRGPEGHTASAGQPARSKHSRRAVYRKWTVSLLYSASIKGNSAEDFLEGVMKCARKSSTHMKTHTYHPPPCPFIHMDTNTHIIYIHTYTHLTTFYYSLFTDYGSGSKHTALLHAPTLSCYSNSCLTLVSTF